MAAARVRGIAGFSFALLVGAAAGFAAGFWLRAPAEPGMGPSDPTDHAPQARIEAPVGPDAAPRRSVEEPRADATSEAALLHELARATLGAFPRAGTRRGSGVISGRVTDTNGAPMGGVRVLVGESPGAYSVPDVTEPGDTPEARLAALLAGIERIGTELATRASSVTSADGTYRIEGLAAGPHWVGAWKEGFEFRWSVLWSSYAPGVRPDAVVDLVGSPAALVTLRIVLPAGSAPTSALVQVVDSTGSPVGTQVIRWDPAHPRIRLASGGYTLTAVAGFPHPHRYDYGKWLADFKSPPTSLTVVAGSPIEPVTLQLAARGGMRVHVQVAGQAPDPHAIVKSVRLNPGEEPDPRRLEQSDLLADHDSGLGRVCFRDLDPGRYLVAVFRQGDPRTPVTQRVVEVGTAVSEVEIEAPPAEVLPEIEVRALDAEGEAIVGAKFMVHTEHSSSWATPVRIREDGTYVLRLDPVIAAAWRERPQSPGRRWSLSLKHAAYGSDVRVPLVPDAAMPIVIRLGGAATLTVRFPSLATSPFSGGVRYALVPAGSDTHLVEMGLEVGEGERPDAEGTQSFGPRPAGEYFLMILKPLSGMRSGPLPTVGPRVPITLRPGANEFEVPARLHYDVTVHVEGKPVGGFVSLVPAESGRALPREFRARVQDGQATFAQVPIGRYRVREMIESRDSAVEFRVPEQTEVWFRATR